jgi:hypothetical protein
LELLIQHSNDNFFGAFGSTSPCFPSVNNSYKLLLIIAPECCDYANDSNAKQLRTRLGNLDQRTAQDTPPSSILRRYKAARRAGIEAGRVKLENNVVEDIALPRHTVFYSN